MINKVLTYYNENGKNFDEVTKVKLQKIVDEIFTDEIVEAIKVQQPTFSLEETEETTETETEEGVETE